MSQHTIDDEGICPICDVPGCAGDCASACPTCGTRQGNHPLVQEWEKADWS